MKRNRILPLYVEERLQVRTKHRKKRTAVAQAPLCAAIARNQRWSMDYMFDTLAGGSRCRVLTLVDLCSRECLVLDVNLSLKAPDVVRALGELKQQGRCPAAITVDNGSEFSSRELDTWRT